jgi:hypothetical protein
MHLTHPLPYRLPPPPLWALLGLLITLAACNGAATDPDVGPRVSGLEVASPSAHTLIFSALQGERAPLQEVTVRNLSNHPLEVSALSLEGVDADAFFLEPPPTLPLAIAPQGSYTFTIGFAPSEAGSQNATLQLHTTSPQSTARVALYGLAARGEGGALEPSLHDIVQTLGYAVDVGGTELILSTEDAPIGDEVTVALFERASEAPVTLTPVARYGPEAPLRFGFVTLEGGEVKRHELGRVAPEDAQRLLPPLQSGQTSFDPGRTPFGIYVRSGSREGSTVSALNTGLARAIRVYPLKDRVGRPLPNSYLIAFEEASNGDYQDAVFVLHNVEPSSALLPAELNSPWQPLFNGRDLTGWYTYLPSHGVDRDPEGVFRVEDGVLHILNVPQRGRREFGYVATRAEFENYHLRLEYRWGEKRFPPREHAKRDSGIIYHVTGPDRVWPRGVEYQIQEGDTGDFWLIGGTTLATTVASTRTAEPRYQQHGEPYTSRPGRFVRVVKDGTYERLEGWNTAEVIVRGNTAVHLINGRVNNRAYGIFQPGPNGEPVPLTRGRILLQAEGAEIMFRNIEIRPLDPLPASELR